MKPDEISNILDMLRTSAVTKLQERFTIKLDLSKLDAKCISMELTRMSRKLKFCVVFVPLKNASTRYEGLYIVYQGAAESPRRIFLVLRTDNRIRIIQLDDNLRPVKEYVYTVPEMYAANTEDNTGVTVCVFPLNYALHITFDCLEPRAPLWVIVGACCASLYSIVVGCATACIASGGLACIGCIIAGILGSWASLAGCYGFCPKMNVCIKLVGVVSLMCARAW